jgi:hypothetical protein
LVERRERERERTMGDWGREETGDWGRDGRKLGFDPWDAWLPSGQERHRLSGRGGGGGAHAAAVLLDGILRVAVEAESPEPVASLHRLLLHVDMLASE